MGPPLRERSLPAARASRLWCAACSKARQPDSARALPPRRAEQSAQSICRPPPRCGGDPPSAHESARLPNEVDHRAQVERPPVGGNDHSCGSRSGHSSHRRTHHTRRAKQLSPFPPFDVKRGVDRQPGQLGQHGPRPGDRRHLDRAERARTGRASGTSNVPPTSQVTALARRTPRLRACSRTRCERR